MPILRPERAGHQPRAVARTARVKLTLPRALDSVVEHRNLWVLRPSRFREPLMMTFSDPSGEAIRKEQGCGAPITFQSLSEPYYMTSSLEAPQIAIDDLGSPRSLPGRGGCNHQVFQ